jgi:hypothetical protein
MWMTVCTPGDCTCLLSHEPPDSEHTNIVCLKESLGEVEQCAGPHELTTARRAWEAALDQCVRNWATPKEQCVCVDTEKDKPEGEGEHER